MNKIEELESRIKALETLLGVKPENVEVDRPFWDPANHQERWGGVPERVAFRCASGHLHDTVLEARGCQEEGRDERT